jgi:hypothetical protein
MSDNRVILAAREPRVDDGVLDALKRAFPEEVVVVHVDTSDAAFFDPAGGTFVAVPDGDPAQCFRPLLERLRAQGLVARLRVERGGLVESLARAADQENARLIVLPASRAGLRLARLTGRPVLMADATG